MTCFDVCKTSNRPPLTSGKPVILLSTQMSIVAKYLLLFQISFYFDNKELVPRVDCDEKMPYIYTYEGQQGVRKMYK